MIKMKKEIEDKIKALKIKGFNDDEIYQILHKDYTRKQIKDIKISDDIKENTAELYTGMQKDLSALISSELKKENRDSSVILNAIKLQADLQEKKLVLKRAIGITKVNKDYIFDRDKKIFEMTKQCSIKEVARSFNISELSVKQAIDRYKISKDSEWIKGLQPTIISETYGLDEITRLRILEKADRDNLKRKEVREIVNKIKNEAR